MRIDTRHILVVNRLLKIENGNDHQKAGQRTDLMDGVLESESSPAMPVSGIFQGKGAAHAKLNMISERINEDREDYHHPGGWDGDLHSHADHHDQRADRVDPFRGEHEERSQDKDQQQAGQFPEEFRDTLVKGSHRDDLSQIIVDDALVEAIAKAESYHGNKEHPVSGAGLKNI